MKYLIDSNIIIYHFNGEKTATKFLLQHCSDIAISFITYIEVLSYSTSKEEEREIKKLFRKFKKYVINTRLIRQTILFRREKKIKLPDAIIASTAYVNHLALVTRNVNDFKNLTLRIINPFEKDF